MADQHEVRFVQYNILSPFLAGASHYSKSDRAALKTPVRLAKIFEKLDEHTKQNAVIALQEIPLKWEGEFTSFFEDRDYRMLSTYYGSPFNGFMGVALAFPVGHYSLMELSVKVPARRVAKLAKAADQEDKLAKQKASKSLVTRAKATLQFFVNLLPFRPIFEPVLTKALVLSGLTKPKGKWRKSPRENVASRYNRAIFARLAPNDGGPEFVVCTYHMPCIFWDTDVMNVHTALIVECFNDFAGSDVPRILLGDFNIKPEDTAYEMVTTGALKESALERIHRNVLPGWKPKLMGPLRSAYVHAPGSKGEPEFTNHTFSGNNFFTGTLDYIFLSSHCEVTEVIELPALTDTTPICPNFEEPSDHILIGATLQIKRPAFSEDAVSEAGPDDLAANSSL